MALSSFWRVILNIGFMIIMRNLTIILIHSSAVSHNKVFILCEKLNQFFSCKSRLPEVYLRPAILFKKRLWHRRFTVNFATFSRTPFCIEHLGWLLLIVPLLCPRHTCSQDVNGTYIRHSEDVLCTSCVLSIHALCSGGYDS